MCEVIKYEIHRDICDMICRLAYATDASTVTGGNIGSQIKTPILMLLRSTKNPGIEFNSNTVYIYETLLAIILLFSIRITVTLIK